MSNVQYQGKVDVDMLVAVKSVLAHISSVSPSSEQSPLLWRRTIAQNVSQHSLRHSAYPHQPYLDILYVLPLRRHRLKLVLTGTSIPLYCRCNLDNVECVVLIAYLYQNSSESNCSFPWWEKHNRGYIALGIFIGKIVFIKLMWFREAK